MAGEQTNADAELLKAASNAAAMLGAVYEFLDRVEKAGGTTCISGIAACNTMVKSLSANRARAEKLVMEPLRAAIKAKGGAK